MTIPLTQGDGAGLFGIEIAGRPRAGKTTLAAALVEAIRKWNRRCELIDEAWPRFPQQNWKRRWEYSAWTLTETVSAIVEKAATSDGAVVVLDKGLVDVQCWFEWFRSDGGLNDSAAHALRSFATLPAWFGYTRLVLVLDASYGVASRRRSGVGRIANRKTFKELAEAYKNVLSQTPVPVHEVSTDELNSEDTLKWALEIVGPLLQGDFAAAPDDTST